MLGTLFGIYVVFLKYIGMPKLPCIVMKGDSNEICMVRRNRVRRRLIKSSKVIYYILRCFYMILVVLSYYNKLEFSHLL